MIQQKASSSLFCRRPLGAVLVWAVSGSLTWKYKGKGARKVILNRVVLGQVFLLCDKMKGNSLQKVVSK